MGTDMRELKVNLDDLLYLMCVVRIAIRKHKEQTIFFERINRPDGVASCEKDIRVGSRLLDSMKKMKPSFQLTMFDDDG